MAFFHVFWGFPAARSRLSSVALSKEDGAGGSSGLLKARRPSRMPTRERFLLRQAYGGTGRPDKCLVVKSLDSSLRPFSLRNMESTAITTREGRPV